MMRFNYLLAMAFTMVVQMLLTKAAVLKDVETRIAPSDAQLPDGYKMHALTFAGTANGVEFNNSGTVDDILPALAKVHPGVDLLAPGVLAGSAANLSSSAASPSTKPNTAAQRNAQNHYCIPVPGQDWYPAAQQSIDELRLLLYKLSLINVGIEPHTCGRLLRCSSLIWVFNDNDWLVYYPLATVADRTGEVQSRCAFPDWKTGGQLFSDGNWNIVVRGGC